MKKVKNFVRDQDMFGKGMALNYHGEGTHNTLFGGMISVIFNLMILSMVISNGYHMVTWTKTKFDDANVKLSNVEWQKTSASMGESGFLPMFHISEFETMPPYKRQKWDSTMDEYIHKPYFRVTKHDKNGKHTHEDIQVVECQDHAGLKDPKYTTMKKLIDEQYAEYGVPSYCPENVDKLWLQNGYDGPDRNKSYVTLIIDKKPKTDSALVDKKLKSTMVFLQQITSKFNKKDFDSDEPFTSTIDTVDEIVMDTSQITNMHISLRTSEIQAFDDWLNIFETPRLWQILKFDSNRKSVFRVESSTFVRVQYSLSREQHSETRMVYTWMDLFNDIGGFLGTMIALFSFIILPVGEHSFVMKTIKTFYVAKVKDAKLMKPDPKRTKKLEKKGIDTNQTNLRPIKIRLIDSTYLFIRENIIGLPILLFPFVYPFTKKGKDLDQLKQVYDKGSEMLDRDFDLYKIIRKLNKLSNYMNNNISKAERRQQNLYYNHKNTIHLDEKDGSDTQDDKDSARVSITRPEVGIELGSVPTKSEGLYKDEEDSFQEIETPEDSNELCDVLQTNYSKDEIEENIKTIRGANDMPSLLISGKQLL